MSASPWLLATRPKTLPAAAVPVWVGAMPALLGYVEKPGSWWLFVCTLVSCLCIQIATNLFNDAIDHEKGADTDARLGPKRVTASGLLSKRAVMGGALGFCALAAAVAFPMIQARGWPIVGIGVVSLFFAYGYTGGPFPLAYRGMGEMFVILFFGFVAVLGSYFVQTGELGSRSIWILGAQSGLYSSVLIAINNLRDRAEDKGTGKRTLAVSFGKTFARWEIAAFCLLPSLLFLWVGQHDWRALLALLISLPLASLITFLVCKNEPGPSYNKFLAFGALQLLLFGALSPLAMG
ncbi:MAG: 1,4-dihydroxy-2-naphthoate octaprenyltransferase [Verrucomicrobiota bacterium]